MFGRFKVAAEFRAVDKVTAPVKRMQDRIGRFTRSAGKNIDNLNRKVNKFGRQAKRIGFAVGIIGTAAIGAFTNVARSGIDFEQAISNVGAVSLKTRDEVAALEKESRRLGRSTIFTATEAANAMEILTRAGLDQQQVLSATEPILNAASAGQLGIAETADIALRSLKGLGLDQVGDLGYQAGLMADRMAYASTKTNSSIMSIGESLSKVGLVAQNAGIDASDTIAAVALLQDVGLDAAVAGTAFKTMLGKLTNPNDKVAKAMKKMNIAFSDKDGNFLSFEQIIGNIARAGNEVGGSFDKVAFLVDLVGQRGQLAANALSKLFESGRLGGLSEGVRGAEGVSKRMAELRLDTAGGDLVKLASAIDAVKIAMFGQTSGPFREMIQAMTEWVNLHEEEIGTKVGGYLAEIFKNWRAILNEMKRLAEVAVWVLGLVVALKALTAIMTIVNLVMIMNPVGLIITGIILLIGLIAALIVKAGGFKKIWSNTLNWFSDKWAELKLEIQAVWDTMVNGVKKAIDWVMKWVRRVERGFGVLKDIVGGKGPGDLLDGLWGFGGGSSEEAAPAPSPVIVGTDDKIARSIFETRSTSAAEVTIRDETGRAEVTGGALGNGLRLENSGAF